MMASLFYLKNGRVNVLNSFHTADLLYDNILLFSAKSEFTLKNFKS